MFHRLERGTYVVEVNTYSGAYQPGFIFMFYDEAKDRSSPARLLKLKVFGEDRRGRSVGRYETEIAGFPTFNKKTKELEVFSKYRGPGDCGSLIRYRFVKGQPVVVEAREQNCTDRIGRPVDARRWPKKKL